MDPNVPPSPRSPYTLDYRAPDSDAPRSFNTSILCFAAGLVGGLIGVVVWSFGRAEATAMFACAAAPLLFWLGMMVFMGCCARRARTLAPRQGAEIVAALCGLMASTAIMLPRLTRLDPIRQILWVIALASPAVAPLIMFRPAPKSTDDLTPP